MILYATAPGGARKNISQLYRSVTWSGSYRTCGRQLQIEAFNPRELLPGMERVELPLGSIVEMERDDGGILFYGQVLTRSQPSGSSILSVTALDNGRYMARNKGWYSFKGATPELAVTQICRDFGIQVGELATTGVKLTRAFQGVPLHQIVATLYNLAGEQTGKRYCIRFEGEALTVREKSEGRPELVIAPGANLIDQATREDASKIYNQVAIYSREGKLIRTLDDPESKKAFGTFQEIITQSNGEDSGKKAQAILEDNAVVQSIPVNCDGDERMVTGQAVALVDAFSGMAGRFWIDSDEHTWRSGVYTTKLELNYRNIMDDLTAGRES